MFYSSIELYINKCCLEFYCSISLYTIQIYHRIFLQHFKVHNTNVTMTYIAWFKCDLQYTNVALSSRYILLHISDIQESHKMSECVQLTISSACKWQSSGQRPTGHTLGCMLTRHATPTPRPCLTDQTVKNTFSAELSFVVIHRALDW